MTNDLILEFIVISLFGAVAIEFAENYRLRKLMKARVDALGLKPYTDKLFDY